jgi:hypothetical protein
MTEGRRQKVEDRGHRAEGEKVGAAFDSAELVAGSRDNKEK